MTILELKNKLIELGIDVKDDALDLLEKYMHYILKMNEEINLTAIKNEDDFVSHMIYDSVIPLSLLDFNNKKVLDIGTGGGYPGTVIATLTSAEVDLLDSTNKKLKIIEAFPDKEFRCINARSEEYAKEHREEYDIVTARAVASLPILLELALPLLKVGGYFVALKGKEGEEEIKASKNALKKLNAKVEKVDETSLPNGDVRINIIIKKIDKTNTRYPRSYSDIKNKHL